MLQLSGPQLGGLLGPVSMASGRPRPRGMFGRGMMGDSLVASPEQRAETERLSAVFGNPSRPMEPMQGIPDALRYNPPLAGMPGQPAPIIKPDAPQPRNLMAPPTGLRMIAGIASDFLSGMNGGPANFAGNLEQRRREQLAAQQADGDFNRRSKLAELAREAEARAPRYFDSNGDQLRYDPSTGETSTIYDAPSPFDEYARSLGLEPGTEDYASALQDYVLRSSGPTATENDLRIEGARYDNRSRLEGQRQGNRLELRGTPTYRQANPAPRAAGRRPAGRSARSEPTAVNPATGQRLVLRNGRWVAPN